MMENNVKKVCMVVSNPFVNDSRVQREAQSLANNGYDVTVFATEGGKFKEEGRVGRITVKRLRVKNYALTHLKFWKVYTVFYKLVGIISAERAAIYHAHDADTLLLCFLAARRNKAKLVYDFHEYWRAKNYFSKNIFEFLWTRLVKKYEYRLIEKLIAPRADALITVNDSLAEKFEKDYRIKEKPVVLFNAPPYVPQNKLVPSLLRRKIGARKDDRLALFLGGLNRNRGLMNLIKSLDYLGQEFKMVFLGYGPLKDKIGEMGKIGKYRGKVFVLDAVPSAEVPKWASGADVGVAPIQNATWSYFHSSPNKIFEYMMAGLPIACSDFPEMRRIVKENKVGVTFNPDDPQDIARAIEEIFEDPEKYREMRENSLKAVMEKFNWEIEEHKLLNLYESI